MFSCFFFQAEDGIRDIGVTGVQTCALPIYGGKQALADMISRKFLAFQDDDLHFGGIFLQQRADGAACGRSEERRVGKECRSRWWPEQYKKNEEETTSCSAHRDSEGESTMSR